MTGPINIDDENLSPTQQAARIAMRQNSGEDAKNLLFSLFKPDAKQIEDSSRANARRQRLASEQAKNHLNKNRQALKEQQQNNKKIIEEKREKESMKLQQREKKKNELYGGVKSKVFDTTSKITNTASQNEEFKLSSLHKSYGKVPRYLSDRKAKIEEDTIKWD